MAKNQLMSTRNKGTRPSGFTLLEVLVSLVLIGVGIYFSTRIFVTGKYFIKETENKSRAMEVANQKMNEYLTKSYEGLVAGTYNGTDTTGLFNWQVKVAAQVINHNAASGKVNDIPYKEIAVVCSYSEQKANGETINKVVRLVNLVPYPYMHLFSSTDSPTTTEVKYYSAACPSSACNATSAAKIAATNLNDATIVKTDFSTKVRSDLQIFYNLSIDITGDKASIDDADLLFSKCFITNKNTGTTTAYEIQTGTPVISQPTVNNVVIVPKLAAGDYTLRVIWFKDHNRGVIVGKRVNIIIFQLET